jgi:hypothetical protein
MDTNVISDMIGKLKVAASVKDDSIFFGGSVIRISQDSFRKIDDIGSADAVRKDVGGDVVFIDGGNAEIFSSPSLCLSFMRVYHTRYRANVRVSSGVDEFYAVVSAGGSQSYFVSLHPVRSSLLGDLLLRGNLEFDSRAVDDFRASSDSPVGRIRGDTRISSIAGIVRRIAELSCASAILPHLSKGDSIVLDGDLEPRTSVDAKLLSDLRHSSVEYDVAVCGMSKTSSMISSKGNPVSFVLDRLSPFSVWYCSISSAPVVFFVKLHSRSSHVFRLDSFIPPANLLNTLSSLAKNSCDAVFFGYPYGLVEADKSARVSDQEADCLKAVLFSKAGEDAALLRKLSASSDAHSILDSIL